MSLPAPICLPDFKDATFYLVVIRVCVCKNDNLKPNQISFLPTALLFVSANLGRHELSLSQLKVRLSLLFLLQLCWVFHHIRIWGFNNMDDNGYPVNPIIREIERWSLFSFLSNFMCIQLGSINWLMQSFLFHVSNNSRPFSLHFLPIIFFLW